MKIDMMECANQPTLETAQHIKLDLAACGDVASGTGMQPAPPGHSDKRSTNRVAA